MCNGYHCALFKLSVNQVLYSLLCHDVDVGSSLVKDDYLARPEDSTANANQLTFPWTEIGAVFGKQHVKSKLFTSYQILKLSFFKDFKDALIWNLFLGVQVKPKGSRKDCWILWDDGDACTHMTQINFADVDTVKKNSAFNNLNYPTHW